MATQYYTSTLALGMLAKFSDSVLTVSNMEKRCFFSCFGWAETVGSTHLLQLQGTLRRELHPAALNKTEKRQGGVGGLSG